MQKQAPYLATHFHSLVTHQAEEIRYMLEMLKSPRPFTLHKFSTSKFLKVKIGPFLLMHLLSLVPP